MRKYYHEHEFVVKKINKESFTAQYKRNKIGELYRMQCSIKKCFGICQKNMYLDNLSTEYTASTIDILQQYNLRLAN